jgi:hypothetical protein
MIDEVWHTVLAILRKKCFVGFCVFTVKKLLHWVSVKWSNSEVENREKSLSELQQLTYFVSMYNNWRIKIWKFGMYIIFKFDEVMITFTFSPLTINFSFKYKSTTTYFYDIFTWGPFWKANCFIFLCADTSGYHLFRIMLYPWEVPTFHRFSLKIIYNLA